MDEVFALTQLAISLTEIADDLAAVQDYMETGQRPMSGAPATRCAHQTVVSESDVVVQRVPSFNGEAQFAQTLVRYAFDEGSVAVALRDLAAALGHDTTALRWAATAVADKRGRQREVLDNDGAESPWVPQELSGHLNLKGSKAVADAVLAFAEAQPDSWQGCKIALIKAIRAVEVTVREEPEQA
jgi:hypothetical protein